MKYLVCFVLVCHMSLCYGGDGVTELSCSDNATCIDNMTKELVRSIRENRTVKLFDLLTIEPIADRNHNQGRANNQGLLARFFNTHAIGVDFGQYGVQVSKATKKGASVNLDIIDNESSNGEGRGKRKKIMQIFLPMLLGMKAASTTIVAIAAVALLTFKAFLASKLALLVTGSMLVKKLMESFGGSLGFQHHPYLYSQYPIDFPSAGAQPGYTMGNSAYSSPEMWTGLGSQPINSYDHGHDTAGQYSQAIAGIQNPNVTAKFSQTATKRWDGLRRKSMYYDSSRNSVDAVQGYQEYDPYEKFL